MMKLRSSKTIFKPTSSRRISKKGTATRTLKKRGLKRDIKDDMMSSSEYYSPRALKIIEEEYRPPEEIKLVQSRPVYYSSYFFRKDIVDSFTRNVMNTIPEDKRVSNPLYNYKLYNLDDIIENVSQRGTVETRNMYMYGSYLKLKHQVTDYLINYLSKNICLDIGGVYAQNAVRNAMDASLLHEPSFDIVVISSKDIETMGLVAEDRDEEYEEEFEEIEEIDDYEEKREKLYKPPKKYFTKEDVISLNQLLEYRLSGVVGFIIVEKGECNQFPNGWSINLICTSKNAIPGSGSILMGLYLYTILCHPDGNADRFVYPGKEGIINVYEKLTDIEEEPTYEIKFETTQPLIPVQQIGILELASAYTNAGGLCMYEKFGFKYVYELYGEHCFPDYYNLPMLLNFDRLREYSELTKEQRQQKVINITAGLDRGFEKSKICNLRDRKEQKLLGYLKSMQILYENVPIDKITNVPEYNNIWKHLTNGEECMYLINQLEMPIEGRNEEAKRKITELTEYLPKEGAISGGKRKLNKKNKRKSYKKIKTKYHHTTKKH